MGEATFDNIVRVGPKKRRKDQTTIRFVTESSEGVRS